MAISEKMKSKSSHNSVLGNWGFSSVRKFLALSLFSVLRSDCIELDFKEISYLVYNFKSPLILKHFMFHVLQTTKTRFDVDLQTILSPMERIIFENKV